MKNKEFSVYSTNKGGMIKSPKGTPKDEPKVTKLTGTADLRAKKRG